MPCLIVLFALLTPRIVLVLVWLFSNNYLGRAYHTMVWPLLGFFLMPLTTLAYAFAINENGSVSGYYFFIVLVAALIDVGAVGGSARSRRRRRRGR